MSASLIAGMVFVLLAAALFAGRQAALRLPEHHADDPTKESIKRATGFLVTLTALVLGLLVSNGKGSFDRQVDSVSNIAARVAQLDELLRHYGPGAAPVRAQLRGSLQTVLLSLWSGQSDSAQLEPGARQRQESFLVTLQALPAEDERQASIKARAIGVADALVQERFRLAVLQGTAAPEMFLAIVVIWLVALFMGIGFCSAQSTAAVAADLVGAFCAATAILLILEFDEPFTGWLQISRAPVDIVMATIGRP